MAVKIRKSVYPENRPSLNEWTQQIGFSSLYVETYSGGLSFGDVIMYAKSQMKKSESAKTGSDNVWPNKTS